MLEVSFGKVSLISMHVTLSFSLLIIFHWIFLHASWFISWPFYLFYTQISTNPLHSLPSPFSLSCHYMPQTSHTLFSFSLFHTFVPSPFCFSISLATIYFTHPYPSLSRLVSLSLSFSRHYNMSRISFSLPLSFIH